MIRRFAATVRIGLVFFTGFLAGIWKESGSDGVSRISRQAIFALKHWKDVLSDSTILTKPMLHVLAGGAICFVVGTVGHLLKLRRPWKFAFWATFWIEIVNEYVDFSEARIVRKLVLPSNVIEDVVLTLAIPAAVWFAAWLASKEE